MAVPPGERGRYRAAVRRVADGVVEDVQEQLLQLDPVAPDLEVVHRAEVEPQALVLDEELHVLGQLADEVLEPDILEIDRLRTRIAPREEEHLADDLGHVGDFLGHELERPLVFVLAPALLQGQGGFGLDDGQRRPQLVGGVGHELALLLERGLEPSDHPVQRRGQQAQLVVRLDVDAPAQVAFADPPGRLGDLLDRPEGPVRQEYPADAGQDDDEDGRVQDDHAEDGQDADNLIRRPPDDEGDAGLGIDVERRRVEPHVRPLGPPGRLERALPKEGLLDGLVDVGELDVGAEALHEDAVRVIDHDELVDLLVERELAAVVSDGSLKLDEPRPERVVEVPVEVPREEGVGERAEDGQHGHDRCQIPEGQAELDALEELHGTRRR